MPRRREVTKREILPDPKYNNRLVARFINNLLKRGKKSVADGFAEPKSPPAEGTHIVHTRVEKSSRALKIGQTQGKYSWLDEHVGMGRYEVTGRHDSVKTMKIGGQKVQVTVTDLDIRQIDDFAGGTDFSPGEFI